MKLRSLSRLRGRVGVGVSPRVTLPVWREFPTRIASFGCDTTSPASGRGEASARTLDSIKNHPALDLPLDHLQLELGDRFRGI
ncbi:hypothetical protein V1289_004470 [Bradyrhizobium sp. AZCC 2289]